MSAYYSHCREQQKCSRFGCRRHCYDAHGHVYTKCKRHRERDRVLQQQYRDALPSPRQYEKHMKKRAA